VVVLVVVSHYISIVRFLGVPVLDHNAARVSGSR